LYEKATNYSSINNRNNNKKYEGSGRKKINSKKLANNYKCNKYNLNAGVNK
jgi:hypothetical protein